MTKPFSVREFEKFCRSKPEGEEYDYVDTRDCAVCQFLEAQGEPVAAASAMDWRDIEGNLHPLPRVLWKGEVGAIDARPWTFGALADRLAKLGE